MKLPVIFILFLLNMTSNLHAFELQVPTVSGDHLRLIFPDYIDSTSKTARLCSSGETLNVSNARLWMRMPNGHEHGTTPLQLRRESQNCYLLTKLNFVMSGTWSLQTWDEKGQLVEFPLFVASQKISLLETGIEGGVSVLIPPASTIYRTKWLVCSSAQILSLTIESPNGSERLVTDEPKLYGDSCYEFDDLLLKQTGRWYLSADTADYGAVGGYINVQK